MHHTWGWSVFCETLVSDICTYETLCSGFWWKTYFLLSAVVKEFESYWSEESHRRLITRERNDTNKKSAINLRDDNSNSAPLKGNSPFKWFSFPLADVFTLSFLYYMRGYLCKWLSEDIKEEYQSTNYLEIN